MRYKINYLAAISALSLMSILLLSGFIDELSAEKSEGNVAKLYGPATKGKVCGDRLCSETGGKIIMPWEKVSSETEQDCTSSNQDTCEKINDIQIENETSDINQEVEEINNSLEVNAPTFGFMEPIAKANVPVTIPLHQGYYAGKPVYYIITDSSDPTHAEIITENQGWTVNLAPLLANATKDTLSKTYMFTNGVPGDGVHGFQGEIFTTTPIQTDEYSALTSHVHVTWDDAPIPFILDSEKELQNAIKQGMVTLTELDVVLNMPQIVWPDGQMPVKVNKTLTDETPFVGGQILDIDLTNMTTTFIAHRGLDYEGRTIYFIVTDATPVGPANSLGATYVPKNAALISNPAAADMFHFMNGIQGPGPLGFQAGIASGFTANATYSPMSRIYFIEWNDPESAILLQTRSDIDTFEKDGKIIVNLARPMAEDHIVNTPIIDQIP